MAIISYYDIDEILAEEELLPVTNNFDFTCLAHLDPDYVHSTHQHYQNNQNKNNKNQQNQNNNQEQEHQDDPSQITKPQNHYLVEGTKFKMPMWSVMKWAQLGFLKLQLPKHFGRRARERLDADPVSVDLRKRNERFYMSGMALINLIQKCTSTDKKQQNTHLHNESQLLKQTLLQSYTGARMRRIFDWTLSNIEDDVTSYTKKLSEMEMRLFSRGAQASHAFTMWKLYGTRRIHVSETALRTSVMGNGVGKGGNGNGNGNGNGEKKTTPAGGKRGNGKTATVSPEGALPPRGLGSRKRAKAY